MPDERILIENAGLVLLAPFFPRYYEVNGLLLHGRFRDANTTVRAARLLQILVSAAPRFSEADLPLNKLLCGIELAIPAGGDFQPADSERANAEMLLKSAMEAWPKLSPTSIDAFRESFLSRPGTLTRGESQWRLGVEKRPQDALLATFPWAFSVVKHPWMSAPIHVEL
jgi:hypothetical protein